MAKKIASVVKLNIPAGKGNPSPPVGPALGQAGINMMEFLKKFNEMTASQMGYTLPVTITVFEDRSYSFIVKQPLMSDLIKNELRLQKGSNNPSKEVAGRMNRKQAEAIATLKMADLNTDDMDMAVRIVAGTARSMGIDTDFD